MVRVLELPATLDHEATPSILPSAPEEADAATAPAVTAINTKARMKRARRRVSVHVKKVRSVSGSLLLVMGVFSCRLGTAMGVGRFRSCGLRAPGLS